MKHIGRNDPCHCGSGLKYKRCCWDRYRATPGSRSTGTGGGCGELTLMIETATGVMARTIRSASPLEIGAEPGPAAERAVQDAAAIWGLPDFVYRPALHKLSSGVRELGDGILIVGGLGVVIQVKTRTALSTDPAKEERWIEKQIDAATRQAAGTIRNLAPRTTELVNARGRSVAIDGQLLRWITVVIIDHPAVPQSMAAPTMISSDTTILLRRDWEFLFEQLKSTHAVAGYLERVTGDSIELGHEPIRYYQLATADAQGSPEALDGAILGPTGRTISAPLLPMAPAATDDRNAHLLVRSIFEDLATTRLDGIDEAARIAILAELDRLQVGHRTEMGRYLIQALHEVSRTDDDEIVWRLRTLRGPLGHAHLGFGAANQLHLDIFGTWVQLRHHDLQQITGNPALTTTAVLLTPRQDGLRAWDTTVVTAKGDLELPTEAIAAYREAWPLPDPEPDLVPNR